MIKVKEDMTGWVMAEHGVPESRLTVIKRAEDYIAPDGRHTAQWLCECSCKKHNRIVVRGSYLKNGKTKSCGCINKEMSAKYLINNGYGKGKRKENKKDLTGEYGIIWAGNTNEKIYFDLEDSEKILKYYWTIDAEGYPGAYINGKRVKMHTLLGLKYYDHKDRNRLNNRRSNLRPATVQENSRNRTKQSNNTSGVIGVSWNKRANKWIAYISPQQKTRIWIGYYINKNDAIIARLKAEKEYYGEFAPQRDLFDKYGI